MTLAPLRRSVFWTAAAVLVLVPAFAAAQKKEEKKLEEAQQKEIQGLVKLVDAAAAGQPAPADFPIQFQNDFLKAQEGRTYVPFTLTIDQTKLPPQPVAMYVRVVSRGAAAATPPPAEKDKKKDDKDKKDDKASQFPFEDVHFLDLKATEGQPIRVSRALSVPGGDYDVYIAMKERAPSGDNKDNKNAPSQKTSVLKQPITVPNYWNNELNTSTLIIADKVEQLSAPVENAQTERPYVLGNMEIQPAADSKFGKKEELQLLLLIYNAGVGSEGKPDIEVEYTFHQKAAEGEKYFNKTEPQKFNAQTLPPTFDVKAGHQVVAGQGIPLTIFPEGDYRLEIKVTDKIAGKSLTREASFTVVGS
jgi:hypothetical protein